MFNFFKKDFDDNDQIDRKAWENNFNSKKNCKTNLSEKVSKFDLFPSLAICYCGVLKKTHNGQFRRNLVKHLWKFLNEHFSLKKLKFFW